MTKVIGIMPLYDYQKESIWMLPGYTQLISKAGATPVILPLTDDKSVMGSIFDLCDGFLYTGGQDVSPEIYNETKVAKCGEISPERDYMEKYIFEKAYEEDKAVFGICRGIQFINAVCGGTLWQDIPSQKHGSLQHAQKPPYDIPVHDVKIDKNSPLYDIFKEENIMVNSYHHQGIKTLGKDLQSMAVSSDGLCEAIRMTGKKFIWAVQWHPELCFRKDERQIKLIQEFIKNCR